MTTVPPVRSTCSKSCSVRETRRVIVVKSFDATGWRPVVYDGTGVRGDGVAFLKNDARLTAG